MGIFYFNKNKKKIECIKKYKKFSIYTEKKFIDSLENTKIEYIKINGKEKLVIKTPNIKKKNEVIKLKKEIQKIINEEINTKLEMHDGKIEIIEIKNNILLIKFLGGCQGCSMVNTTLTNIVTETIKKKFKNIEEIHDITNHQNKENAYIK